MFDTHIHTSFSSDSTMTIEQVMRMHKELSLGIVLTEHWDFDYPPPLKFEFSLTDYFHKYQPYRSDNFLLGIEIGLQTHVLEKNTALVRTNPFDMIIASIHAVQGYDIFYPEYFENARDKHHAYLSYLETLLENIQLFDEFDTLGHIDFVCRKAPYEDTELYYSEFPDIIDAIFQTIIQKEKALELNTRRLENPESVKALLPIYKRYHELGGRYITIGSDAHTPDIIGKSFIQATNFASECLLIPVYFKERKMHSAL